MVRTLTQLAAGDDHRDREDAGRALANFADLPEAWQPLHTLLLDPDDTAVTRATAEALLRREDETGLAAVASALTEADPNHADWLHTAILDVFGVYATSRDAAVRLCDTMIAGSDTSLRPGAVHLRAVLTAIDPVLRPAPR